MDALKEPVRRYMDVAKKLAEVNAAATALRSEKNSIELDLAAVYAEHGDLPGKIQLTSSNMVFRMKKPGEWKKGWSLSKKQLEVYLQDILGDRGAEVFNELVKRHEPTLIADDYGFELQSREWVRVECHVVSFLIGRASVGRLWYFEWGLDYIEYGQCDEEDDCLLQELGAPTYECA